MTSRAARQSADDWFRIIAEFHQSGLSADDFCLHRGYATSTFHRWRLRYEKQRHPSTQAPRMAGPAFVEALASDSGTVTLTLGDSVRMDCPLSLGIERIARLAKAVATDDGI